MDLYPAVDIRAGAAVRLTQGDFDRQDDYGDPLALAQRFAAAGARWLHVVDLDAARTGRPANRGVVLAITEAVDVQIQCGGGVRTGEDVAELLDGGVSRVVLGTAALENPGMVADLAASHPGRVAVGVDYRRTPEGSTEVALRGWEQGTGVAVDRVLAELEGSGVAAVVVTAIDRDGTLGGPDITGLSEVLGSTEVPVIASGGVGGPADIEALARLRVAPGGTTSEARAERRLAGAITGRALVDGRLTVEEGVAACARSG